MIILTHFFVFIRVLEATSVNNFPYQGIEINVSDENYKSLDKMYNGIYKKIYELVGIEMLEKNDILESLQNNFVNMVNSFRANQGNLPKCIQEAFNKFLNEIKTPYQNGKPKATIEWKLYDDRPGRSSYDRSKYNKDYDDFYFQDVNSSTITVNGWDFNIGSNCGGNKRDIYFFLRVPSCNFVAKNKSVGKRIKLNGGSRVTSSDISLMTGIFKVTNLFNIGK